MATTCMGLVATDPCSRYACIEVQHVEVQRVARFQHALGWLQAHFNTKLTKLAKHCPFPIATSSKALTQNTNTLSYFTKVRKGHRHGEI